MSDKPENSNLSIVSQSPPAGERKTPTDAAPRATLSSDWFGGPRAVSPASPGPGNRLLPSWLSGIAPTETPTPPHAPEEAREEIPVSRAPNDKVAPCEESRAPSPLAVPAPPTPPALVTRDAAVTATLAGSVASPAQPFLPRHGLSAPSPAPSVGAQPPRSPNPPAAPAAPAATPAPAPISIATPSASSPPPTATPAPPTAAVPHQVSSSPRNATLSAPQDAVTPQPRAVTHRRFLKGVVIGAIATSAAGAALVLSRGGEAPTPGRVVDPSGDASQNRPAPVNPEGRLMPAGSFTMGSPESEAGRNDDEAAVGVTLTHSFWFGTHEVTQGIWSEVMRSNPSYFSACGAECPVERISWFDSAEFMNRLSARDGLTPCYSLGDCSGTAGSGTVVGEQAPVWGRGDFECATAELVTSCSGYRFPTEAEWEFAARANTTGATYVGALEFVSKRNAPNLSKIAWYAGNSVVDYNPAFDCSAWKARELSGPRCGPKPVGLRTPNPNQLQDVLGNVWEWTSDWYKKDRSVAGVGLVDPQGPQSGEIRVFKGGSWRDSAVHSRSAARRGSRPQWRYASLGLRLARNQP